MDCASRVQLMIRLVVLTIASSFVLLAGSPAFAQDAGAPAEPPEVELNLVNLSTTQSLSRHRSYFRLTHRFARDLGLGDFSDLAADLFSLDNGAVIGLEYRFGITSNVHAGLHRNTQNKTLQAFGRWDALRQGRLPFGASVYASIEGLDNLQDGHQPAVGAVLSYTHGRALALYVSPAFVDGTRAAGELSGIGHEHDHLALTDAPVDTHDGENHSEHDGTFFLGVGGRVRLLSSVFIAAEISPRLSGHDPGDAGWGVSLEKVTRGHTLALTLTNFFGTTPGQVARGGIDALYLGFNITRKF
jgi:hypothetical protein